MKKYYTVFISAIVFISLMISCTTIYENDYVLKEDDVLDLSENQVIFSPDGGVRTILLVSEYESYTLKALPDWLEVQEFENYFVLSAIKNDENISKVADIEVSVGDTDIGASEVLRVIQYGNDYADLSLSGTSNCYLVLSGGGTYRFNAAVKGSGNSVDDGSGLADYIKKYGLTFEDASFARLLWETVPDGDLTSSYDVIDGSPVYCDGEIYFKTGDAPGNALIAVCDAGGNILWSWHIWSVPEYPGTSQYNGYEWIDRNLGAVNNIPGDSGNKGMLYQWGRKDPFAPTSSAYGEEVNNINVSIGDGYLVPDLVSFRGYPYTESPGNIPYSILHPNRFINFASYYSKDWYLASGKGAADNSYLWGNPDSESYSKSIFDPCPQGYIVPPVQAYNVYESVMKGWDQYIDFGRVWSGGNGDYFPLQGYGSGTEGETPLFGIGQVAGYWTSTPSPDMSASYFISLSTNETYRSIGYRMSGFSIRCVKEKE